MLKPMSTYLAQMISKCFFCADDHSNRISTCRFMHVSGFEFNSRDSTSHAHIVCLTELIHGLVTSLVSWSTLMGWFEIIK